MIIFIFDMDHQPDHPIEHLIQRTQKMTESSANLAILSPLVKLSYIFHLALAILRRSQSYMQSHSHQPVDPGSTRVLVIGSCSQSEFQQAITEENDTFLMNGPVDDDQLANLLNQIQFHFCLDLNQLITLLCDLSQESSSHMINHLQKKLTRPVALVILDLSNYFNLFNTTATLSDLTRLLGFINATQSRLNSTQTPEHVVPIYLFDRIKHTQTWSLSNSNPEETRSVEKVFKHFFPNTWSIEETPENGSSPTQSQGTKRYRFYPISLQDSSVPHDQDIIYQVCDVQQQAHEHSIHTAINGPFQRTSVFLEPTSS